MPRKTYDYKRADFDDLRSRLQLLPSDMSHSDDVDIYWSQWKDLFLATVAECVPMKTIRDTNSPPWIDREVKFALRRKYRALRKYRENKTVELKLKLRSLSNEIKKLVRQKHRDYLLKIEDSLKENLNYFGTITKLSYTIDRARILRSPSMGNQQKLQPKRLSSLMLISALCLHHPSRTKHAVCKCIP